MTSTRRGASLVELIAVMSACSVILTMSAGLIHRAMLAQSQTRSFFDVERSALRLSGQFRRDVHRANAVPENAAMEEGTFLRLQLPDHETVEYRRLAHRVLRVLSHNGQTVSREEFPFSTAIDVAVREEASPRRLVLAITSEETTTVAGKGKRSVREMPVSFQAAAVIGRDRRFTFSAVSSEDAK
jgi:type II secretory pathway component PulJ